MIRCRLLFISLLLSLNSFGQSRFIHQLELTGNRHSFSSFDAFDPNEVVTDNVGNSLFVKASVAIKVVADSNSSFSLGLTSTNYFVSTRYTKFGVANIEPVRFRTADNGIGLTAVRSKTTPFFTRRTSLSFIHVFKSLSADITLPEPPGSVSFRAFELTHSMLFGGGPFIFGPFVSIQVSINNVGFQDYVPPVGSVYSNQNLSLNPRIGFAISL